MAAQRLEYAPDLFEIRPRQHLVVGEVRARRHHHRQHHIAVLLARRASHHPAHRLHHVDLRALRFDEDDRIERGHVHALGQALGVGHDAAPAGVIARLQPGDDVGTVQGVARAVDVANLAVEQPAGALRRHDVGDRPPVLLHGQGVLDGVGEGDGAARRQFGMRRPGAAVVGGAGGRVGEGVPAAGELHRLVDFEADVVVNFDHVEVGEHGVFGHGDDEHLVVGEVAAVDGLAETHPVEFGAVGFGVVHGVDVEVAGVLARFGLDLARVEARGGGHVQAPVREHPGGVVDQGEGAARIGLVDAGGAVGLVAQRQVELRCARGLGVGH